MSDWATIDEGMLRVGSTWYEGELPDLIEMSPHGGMTISFPWRRRGLVG